MSIESYIPVESAEGGSQSAEVSEQYKQAAKKARAGIKRTQKDEKRAKKYDFMLAKFLVEMILKKKYDTLLEHLFSCFDMGYGTNFLLGILSLVYLPISDEIRKASGSQKLDFHYDIGSEYIDFDDHHLPEAIRHRVNAWIEDMESVMHFETSSTLTKRTLNLIVYDETIRDFTQKVFSFFFDELHIRINEAKARNYSDFILGELQKKTRSLLEEMQSIQEQEGEGI